MQDRAFKEYDNTMHRQVLKSLLKHYLSEVDKNKKSIDTFVEFQLDYIDFKANVKAQEIIRNIYENNKKETARP